MKQITSWARTYHRGLIVLAMVLAVLSSSVCAAQSFAKGYKSVDSEIRPGMIVALTDTSGSEPNVERASKDSVGKIIGVATDATDQLVTVASRDQQVYVQSAGQVAAFVSNLNGDVKKGDKLTASPLKGTLSLADETNPIIAVALADFDTKSAESKTIQIDGGAKSVTTAKVRVTLDASLIANQPDNAPKSALEKIGRAVTGRDVSALQVAVALVIFIVVIVAEGAIIYGAVNSALTSLGRNPLAKHVIRMELFRVMGMALVVLFVGLGAVYLMLRI